MKLTNILMNLDWKTLCQTGGLTHVNGLHKSGSCWRWPQTRDMISYEKSDILRIIIVPVAAGHRGQFTFSDFFI